MNNIEKSIKDLETYEKVNACNTFQELASIILSLADENGMIQGRIKKFNASEMAERCLNFKHYAKQGYANCLTRQYGIRQQALYLTYYHKG